MFYNVEGSISQFNLEEKTAGGWEGDSSTISLAGDYYLNEMFGLGLGFTNNSGDDVTTEGQEYIIRARYFILPALSMSMEYSTFSSDNEPVVYGSDEFAFTLTGRI